MPQHFHQSTAPSAKHKEMAVMRIALECLLRQQRQAIQSPCACPCGRSPARLARRSEPGSSPAPDLRQRADHALPDRSIARSNDPHPHATAELNLNRFRSPRRGRSRAWLRDNRHRREPRRGTLSATELLPPSEQLADVNAGGSRHFRGHCARLQRSSNDPLFLRNRPSTPALHLRDDFDLHLAHRTLPRISPMTCDSASYRQCGLHRTRTSISGAPIFCAVAVRAQGQHRNARVSVRAIIFTVATVALPYVGASRSSCGGSCASPRCCSSPKKIGSEFDTKPT